MWYLCALEGGGSEVEAGAGEGEQAKEANKGPKHKESLRG